jgi:PGF-CTERM protein
MNSPVTVNLNPTAINNYLSTCTPDGAGDCTVPLKFSVAGDGILHVSNINVQYPHLHITQASTDKQQNYTIGESTVISATVKNESYAYFAADNVSAKITKPDNSVERLALNETSTGNYNGSFTAALEGNYNAIIYANKTGYVGGAASLSFGVNCIAPAAWNCGGWSSCSGGAQQRTCTCPCASLACTGDGSTSQSCGTSSPPSSGGGGGGGGGGYVPPVVIAPLNATATPTPTATATTKSTTKYVCFDGTVVSEFSECPTIEDLNESNLKEIAKKLEGKNLSEVNLTELKKKQPGFEMALAIAGLLAVAYLAMRKRRS